MERESRNTTPLEEDFYRWLSERKKVWRLQRLAKRHAGGQHLLAERVPRDHGGDSGHGGGAGSIMRALEAEA